LKTNFKINKFWINQAYDLLSWEKKPKVSFTKKNNFFKWFPDGKINLYKNCITKNLSIDSNKIALITISNKSEIQKYTYLDIDKLVIILSNFLKSLKKNNLKILIHSSASLESAISMLTCAKLGIHFCVIFKELEIEAINSRIKIFKPDIILSNGKNSNLHKVKSKKKLKIFDIKKIINNKIKNFSHIQEQKLNFYNSNRDLFTLFTSGSTGVPKGVTHSTGGYLLYAKYTCLEQFGMNKNSTVLTASDAGWINGHTYSLFGPLSIGATSVLLETPMLLLQKNLLTKILKEKISILYLPVTLIRLMRMIYRNQIFKKHSLVTLGSMGEPLAKSVGTWFAKTFNLKNKSIINTYYQTETAGIICSPKYTETIRTSPHGSVGDVVSKAIKISRIGKIKKEIKIIAPWPGCMKKIINGVNYYKKYWDKNKNFRMFDLATKKSSFIEIHGRIDDVINIRGHRIGSEEIESILLKNENISECCSIAIPDKIEGYQLILFIVSKKEIDNEIKKAINSNFGSFALPKKIFYVSSIPKTRSGKILRRILRNIYINPNKKNYGDSSTIVDYISIKEIQSKIKKKNH
jgi:acetyl-CoA synthetase